MGRTSKFSFPLPGRKHNSTTRDKGLTVKTASGTSSNLSKAQRILGTDNELNIDSPTQSDGHSWRYPGSRTSGMSISVSESTQSTRSTVESESFSGSNAGRSDYESGVSPWAHRLRGKASSTLLGQSYGEDVVTDTSSLSRRVRHEGSDSTLKSYYDRQTSPLSISQQTSASSARDLALRKGFPPIIPRSPLLQVDSIDPFNERFSESNHDETLTRGGSMRKKPARLDLSMLFPKTRRSVNEFSPSSVTTNVSLSRNSSSGRRKLTKAPSKQSLQPQKDTVQAGTGDDRYHSYDHYEPLSARSPHMGRIPESRVPDQNTPPSRSNLSDRNLSNGNHQPQKKPPSDFSIAPRGLRSHSDRTKPDISHLSPTDGQTFSWKNVRSNIVSPPWEVSSSASISSRNTKTSRHTSASAFSNQDLKQNSVLSLSSDSEEDASGSEIARSPVYSHDNKVVRMHNGNSPRPLEGHRSSKQHLHAPVNRMLSSRKGVSHISPSISIPDGSLPISRISGPLAPRDFKSHGQSTRNSRTPEKRGMKSSREMSSANLKSSGQHPTPPLSPASIEFGEEKESSGRYMAVTQQEEALLEALRQKRARMREKIIAEHETAKSPARLLDRSTSRYSEASSLSTLRGLDDPNGGHILLYLDTPISDAHSIDTAEPSPDLSDFLSFGSDEESTPRTSYIGHRKDRPRPDSSITKGERISPLTPPSAARLSAVGSTNFRGLHSESKGRTTGVHFLDERKMMSSIKPQDFLPDENETDVIWGM